MIFCIVTEIVTKVTETVTIQKIVFLQIKT